MDRKETLTNESVRLKFVSQFELVNYAIKLANQMIFSGRGPRVEIDNNNPAVIIIEEIDEGQDHLDDVIVVSKEIIKEPTLDAVKPEKKAESAPVEKKKARRILA